MAETVTWIDPGGASYPWDGSTGNYLAIVGRTGAFAPTTQIIEQEVPLQPGARLRLVKTTSRPVRIPLLVKAPDEATFASVRRTLRYALNPNRGAGTLQIAAADGMTRQLTCYCESGYEGDESDGNRGPGHAWFPLQFRALDPYWYDANSTTQTFSPGGGSPMLHNPFLPIVLSASGISNSFTISNSGDVQCWPIWTITGPGVNPTLTNNTTGKSMALTVTLTGGQTITIDTRTGYKTVKREDGSLHYSYLSFTSSLWPLMVGVNAIALSMTGTTSASSLQLQYKQAYEGF